jgi:hypothetical protein
VPKQSTSHLFVLAKNGADNTSSALLTLGKEEEEEEEEDHPRALSV